MMTSLSARIEELENRKPSGEVSMIILRRLLRPGQVHGELNHLRDTRSQCAWERMDGEGEDAFIERASKGARNGTSQVVCLVGDDSASA